MRLSEIQHKLAERKLAGWLFYDFRGSDPVAQRILGLPPHQHTTRRWFYFIPAQGEPQKLVHAIETSVLDSLPGNKSVYLDWRSLEKQLGTLLADKGQVAMQYSPGNAIPYVSRVDAGTIEQIRSTGASVVSSADLIQEFEAVFTAKQLEMHLSAADALGRIVDDAFFELAQQLKAGKHVTEWSLQKFVLQRFKEEKLVTDHPPIVAVNAHAADPHFAPSEDLPTVIRKDSLVLLDIWGKNENEGAVFADITWMGFTGKEVPAEMSRVFDIVRDARDRAVGYIQEQQLLGRRAKGCDVDDACRAVIVEAGLGDKFIHRTGHSIHETGHGNGANLDNLETRDERELIPGTCFSVEPGIYLAGEFGVRSEINVYLPSDREIMITGRPAQRKIVEIL